MPIVANFVAQIALYSLVPFFLVLLRNPRRVTYFYIYISILLTLCGFLGSIYALPITPTLNISGGGLAYGALFMATVLLVIIERDIVTVRRVIELVIFVNIFRVLLFTVLHLALQSQAVVNPFDTSAGVFALSLPVTVLGGILIILELGILLYTFEAIKKRIVDVTLVSCLYTLCFVGILCLDGLLFPLLAFTWNPSLPAMVFGGVTGKLLMGLMYSIPMLVFLLVYRRKLSEFVEQPMTLSELLRAPQERLVEEIQRQRQSLEVGEKQLKEYAERLALATESAGLGIWDLDLARKVVVWDERSFEMHGLPPRAGELALEDWEKIVHADDLEAVQQESAAALAGERDYHAQFRAIWPSGEVRYIEAYGKLLRSADGTPLRMIGVNVDITQRKQLALENEQLTSQFYQAQRLESIGRLAGGIAHDFNNVLVPISSFAELGMLKTDTQSKHYLYFQRIKEAADRASRLTRQILAFSRNQALEMKEVDLNEIVTSFEHMVQRLIGEDITLELELAPEPCMIKADPGQIEQVLMNLVVNARDAMPEGGLLHIAARRIYLDEERAAADSVRSGWQTELIVRDTGTGMDEAIKQHIFDPFFTTKPLGKGTGLGMATVFGIVKQHHGHIAFESQPGLGTTFTILLPSPLPTPQEISTLAVDGV